MAEAGRRGTRPKKTSRKPGDVEKQIARPLTPAALADYGELSTLTPAGSFDPRGAWKHTYRIWMTGGTWANYRGYLTLERTAPADGAFGLEVLEALVMDRIPNIGQWLGREGYDPVYVGKWHVPESYTLSIPGFSVIPAGNNGNGTLLDRSVSRACQGFLHNRDSAKPFLLVASFLQPHDVCQWTSMHKAAPDELPYPQIAGELPPLPSNFGFDPREPAGVANQRRAQKTDWSEMQWRYYVWSYCRMIEEVDAEIGRVLDALEASGLAGNTVVVFTSDHGEGRGRHQMIVKNYLYEEALKVPLIFSYPDRIAAGVQDKTHLVSGVDVMATVCDFAGVKPPPGITGGNLRPLLERREVEWREFAMAEVKLTSPKPGFAIRTPDYKYVTYHGDPVEQLFDMRGDPGETRNLAPEAKHTATLSDHRKLLRQCWSRLDLAPNAPKLG